jgi:error-prone DNA polymerase
MEKFREDFIRGARAQNVAEQDAEMIFTKLTGFSEFGFPKSHAYAFGMLAYQSAYLRIYYPAEYYAALLNNQPMGFYAPHVLLGDAKRHAISTLRVAINTSGVKCQVAHLGLAAESPREETAVALAEPRAERALVAVGARSEVVASHRGRHSSGRPWGGHTTSVRPEPASPAPSLPIAKPRQVWRLPPVKPQERKEGQERLRHASEYKPGDFGQLLLGLTTVRGVGEDLAKAIVTERDVNGPFLSLSDLLRRTGLHRAAAENLIAVGALSEFGLGRRELLWQLGLLLPGGSGPGLRGQGVLVRDNKHRVNEDRAIRASARDLQPTTVPYLETLNSRRPKRNGRQMALDFDTKPDMVALPEMDEWDRMVADYGLLGLSPSYHPLGLLRDRIPTDVLPHEKLRDQPDGTKIRTAGLVVCRQRPGTAKGFVFLLAEDESGLTNIVIQPDLYEQERTLVRAEPYLLVEGTVQIRSGSLNVIAERVAPLSSVLRDDQQIPDALLPFVASAEGMPSNAPRQRVPVAPDNADEPRWQAAFRRMPRPPMQHGGAYPGNPNDPREIATMQRLQEVTPASHDFH